MAKIFVIANQKGGVGKTTTTVNLAASLHKHGQRTLLVDLDPQGNATMGSGVDKRSLPRSVYQVMLGMSSVAESTHVSPSGGYSVLGANRELAGAEVELVDVERREERLKNALAAVDDLYDFVLIDCPPSLSLLTLNGFCAAHGVIIPMQCEYFALEGLSDLVNTIKKVHANFNTNLRVIGLLRVMFDPRMTLGQQVSRQLEQHFGDKVFKAVIPRNVRLAEAPSYGMPGVIYDPQSKGAKAYLEFGAEMVSRLQLLDAAAARAATQSARPAAATNAAATNAAATNASATNASATNASATNAAAQSTPPQNAAQPVTAQPTADHATTQATVQPATTQPTAQPTAQPTNQPTPSTSSEPGPTATQSQPTPPHPSQPDGLQPQATTPSIAQLPSTPPNLNSWQPSASRPEAPWVAPSSQPVAHPTVPAVTSAWAGYATPKSTTQPTTTQPATTQPATKVSSSTVSFAALATTGAHGPPGNDSPPANPEPKNEATPADADPWRSAGTDRPAAEPSYPITPDRPAVDPVADALSSSADTDGDALPVQETTASAT